MPFENLFKPGKIGKLELKNRIVLPAMGTEFAGESGEVTDTLINWLARRAKGGAGLILTEITCAATAIDPLRTLRLTLRADDERFVAGLSRLTEAIHKNGAKAGLQLSPGGGAQALWGPWIPENKNARPVSPSGVPALGHNDNPRSLTVEEIRKCAELCGDSARNARRAGFDMIELHAHGGYLIAQFMSPYFNKRTDEYGGSLDNRCRFLLEIVDSMKKATGSDFPITVKYSIEDFLPGGWDIEMSRVLAKKLEAAGADGIGISSGIHGAKMPAVLPYFYPRGTFLPFAEAMKEAAGLPVFVGGRLDKPELADKAIRDGKTDFVYEGRALIADPDWPQKIIGGQPEEVRPCLACNECRQAIITHQPLRCSVNAIAGREGELDSIKPSERKKKVLVVGGGPAGMETARIAALRGHEVTLCEKNRQLGGLMLLGGVHNEEVTAFSRWLVSQLKRLPIAIKLKTEATLSLVEKINPDAVVLANGGTFVTPDIPGIDRDNVFSARDLLNLMNGIPVKKGILLSTFSPLAKRAVSASRVSRFLGSNFPIKKNVAIIGGQFPGCSLALALAKKGKRVTIIEESDHYGYDVEAHTLVGLKAEVQEGNVKILISTKIEKINDKGLVIRDEKGNETLQKADTVIVALELAPSDSKLGEEIQGKIKEIYTIGDAKSFQRMKAAISEGYSTAFNL